MFVLWGAWTFGASTPFGECIEKRKHYHAYAHIDDATLYLVRSFIRIKLDSACAAHVANHFNGAIAAISGVAVAFFTFTLWQVTWGMSKLAEQQRLDLIDSLEITRSQANIADRQTKIFEKQLRSRLPSIDFHRHELSLRMTATKPPDIDCCLLLLRLVNRGETIAYNANYWFSDPIFIDRTAELDGFRFARDERIVADLFRSEGQPGIHFVGPGDFFDTDQKELTQADMHALSIGKKRLYFWCVMRCGSRLEEPEWFAETAVYLEFVFEDDQVTAFHGGPGAPGDYFRVRVAGHRYREGYDPQQGSEGGK